jgi:hypothetical protein
MDGVPGTVRGRRHLAHLAQHRQQHRQSMGTHVPQGALLPPPRRVGEGALAGEHRPEPFGAGREPALHARLFTDPRLGLGEEARGEEDHRGDIALPDGLDHRPALLDRRREGLVQQQMAPRPRGPRREARLHGRWQGDRDGVHVGEQRVDLVVRARAVLVGQLLGGLGTTAPHPGEVQLRMRAERGSVGRPGPGTGAEQSDAHTAASLAVLPNLAVTGPDRTVRRSR